MSTLRKFFLVRNSIGKKPIFYCVKQLLTCIYTLFNKKFSITFCFWIRSYLFFKWKIHHYALSVLKKKRHCCIFSLNVCMWFTFGNSWQLSLKTIWFYQHLHQIPLFGIWSDTTNYDEPIIIHVLPIFKV